jgi:hypothetical protein
MSNNKSKAQNEINESKSNFLIEVSKAVESIQAKYFGDKEKNPRGLFIIAIDSEDVPGNPESLLYKNCVHLVGDDDVLADGMAEMMLRDENVHELFAEAYGQMQKKILFGS